MKKLLLLLFITFNFTNFSQQNFRIEFDYARFSYDDSSKYVEFYYSFYHNQLTPTLIDNQEIVSGILNLVVKNKDDKTEIINKTYQFNNISDTALNNNSLIGNIGFIIPFGEYVCYVIGKDGNNNSNIDSISFEMNLNKHPENIFSLSDIQIASSIKQSDDQNSMFYKNTYEVIPNPSNLFGETIPVIYYYIEIYNLTKNISSENIKIETQLLNGRNETVLSRSKLLTRKNDAIVDAGILNISKQPTGGYHLLITLSDSVINQRYTSSKRIFIYNPLIIDTTISSYSETSMIASEFAVMSIEELDEVFSFSKYIASKQEVTQWEKLTESDAKKNFLFEFWKRRDMDLTTSQNEFKKEYFDRVQKANNNFTTIQRKGWRTDRGRVFIIYGEPSEIERFPNQVDTKPYEIWQYNQLEGGVVFVFADLTGFSDYSLIHSTVRGELRDDQWQRKITTY